MTGSIIEYGALASTLVYILLLLALGFGIRRSLKRQTAGQSDHNLTDPPDVTVIVAARNEAANICRCLASIAQLNYPAQHLRVLVVDDGSTDSTNSIVSGFIREKPHFRLINLDDSETPEGKLKGKPKAVDTAIQQTPDEFIMLTDADCEVPADWVYRTLAHLVEPDVGIVTGFTLLDQKNDGTPLFGRLQSLDLTFLLSIGKGFVELNNPVSCIGNNLSFKKSVYTDVGGFEQIPFSVTEDFAFFKTVAQTTSWKTRFLLDTRQQVCSRPLLTLKAFYRQRKRWAVGCRDLDRWSALLAATSFLTHLLVPVVLMMDLTHPLAYVLPACLLGIDFWFLYGPLKRLRRTDLLRFFPLYQLFYFVYIIVFPIVVFLVSKKVEWKGRIYE